ncbi:MAG: hypothetical protein AAGI68_12805 [Planctomycetota bacterium]
MRQIKLFEGCEDNFRTLESDVNAWLAEQDGKVEIVKISGNIAPQTAVPQASSTAHGISSGPKGRRRFAPSDILILVEYNTQ